MKESNLKNKILLNLSKKGFRLFRNNVGLTWTGNTKKLPNGDILISNPRPFHSGLCVGSSDLIGWKTETVTQEMVGQSVAIFTAIEIKTKNVPVTDKQKNFLEKVNECGGIGIVSRDENIIPNLNPEKYADK